jgi:hypothetical protein
MEEPPRRTNHPDKCPLRGYLVDKPDPELRPILHFVRHHNLMVRSPQFMDQRSIVLYLNRKGRETQVIHDDLVARFGAEATA